MAVNSLRFMVIVAQYCRQKASKEHSSCFQMTWLRCCLWSY